MIRQWIGSKDYLRSYVFDNRVGFAYGKDSEGDRETGVNKELRRNGDRNVAEQAASHRHRCKHARF